MADYSFIFPFHTLQNEFWKVEKKMSKLSEILCIYYVGHSSKASTERRENAVEKEHLMNLCKMVQFQKLCNGKVFSFPFSWELFAHLPAVQHLTLFQIVHNLFGN